MALSTEVLKTVTNVLDNYNKSLKEIRDNNRLSEEGRRAEIAETYERTKKRVEQLRTKDEALTSGRVQDLRRQLFGLGNLAADSAVTSFRDAQDRVAAAATPEQLGELMERANIAGDSLLVRAGFARAWQMSQSPAAGAKWRPLVNVYCEENPHVAGRLEELDALVGGTAGGAVQEAMLTSVPRPAEVR